MSKSEIMAIWRLNRLLAARSGMSRRAADLAILAGRLSGAEGKLINPAVQVEADIPLRLDGRFVPKLKTRTVVALNKPRGVVTTRSDRHAAETVTSYLQRTAGGQLETKTIQALRPAGRLDEASRGLLVLSDDGDLINYLSHPSYEIKKEYELLIQAGGSSETLCMQALEGITDQETGEYLQVDACEFMSRSAQSATLNVIMHTGRKHELRRLFRAFGAPLLDVRRIAIGDLRLSNLKLADGEWKVLSESEVKQLTV